MKRRTCLAAAAAAVVLSACGNKESTASSSSSGDKGPAAASLPVSIEKIEADGKGFNVGSTMAARTVYVFFDAQCPHCAELWEAAKPLKSQARFVWMPVGLLGDRSFSQGAAILSAADPVAAMEQNESSVRQRTGGITAMNVPEAQIQVVRNNTQLFTAFGFNGVPAIVGKHATTGELVTLDGAVPTMVLAQKLGLTPPAS